MVVTIDTVKVKKATKETTTRVAKGAWTGLKKFGRKTRSAAKAGKNAFSGTK